MQYNGEGVHAFVCALEDMQNSNLIYVDKKLSQVLRCLSYYDEFRTVLSYCNQNFDYQVEKRKALTKIGENNFLKLPKNPKTLVALVVNMLVEFDDGRMDIVAFSNAYFPQSTQQESYNECFLKLLDPFKIALVSLVVDGISEETPIVERTIEFVSSGLQQQTEYLLVNMVKVVQEAHVQDDERAELSLLLEGFAAALDTRDALMIKCVWLGLKRTLATFKLCQKEIEKVDEAMKLYLIVK